MDVNDAGDRQIRRRIRQGEMSWWERRRDEGRGGSQEDRRHDQEPQEPPQRLLESGTFLEGRRLVDSFPGEFRLRSAEVAERRRLRVDWLPEVELLHDAAGRELEVRAHQLGDLRLGDL